MDRVVSPDSDSVSSLADNKFCDNERPVQLLQGFSSIYKNKQFIDVNLIVAEQVTDVV